MSSIVITPTYNESGNIIQLIDAVMKVPLNLDMLVVDDNSPDGTADFVEQASRQNKRIHLIRRTGNRGFGPSYVDGFKWALERGYEIIFSMDADFSHDPESLPTLAKALEEHDMVLGSRYYGGRVNVVNWPFFDCF